MTTNNLRQYFMYSIWYEKRLNFEKLPRWMLYRMIGNDRMEIMLTFSEGKMKSGYSTVLNPLYCCIDFIIWRHEDNNHFLISVKLIEYDTIVRIDAKYPKRKGKSWNGYLQSLIHSWKKPNIMSRWHFVHWAMIVYMTPCVANYSHNDKTVWWTDVRT